ncbi:MAG: PilZ domain-containing protein [Chloroflexi bacterium]|nr:PilZ domain-containing protein [Chloroflexota bacterium]
MKRSEQIIADLGQIASVNVEVELLNLYRGLPIVHKASIAKIEGGMVTFRVHKHQLVCLDAEKQTVILSEILQEAVGASVVALDKQTSTADLTNFVYTAQKLGERMMVRVEPKGSISVEVAADGGKAVAALADISLNGVGLRMPGVGVRLKKKMPVKLTLQLPNAQINAAGVVRYVKQDADSFRAGVDFSQDVRVKALVAQYITGRRAEILNELDAA